MKCKSLQIFDSTPFSSWNQPFENLLNKELNNKKWLISAVNWNGVIFLKSNSNLYFQKFWNNNSHTPLSCHKLILHQIKPLTITNRQTFFLTPLHRAAQLSNVKILKITMDIHHFTKLPLLGFFIKKSPKPIKTWKLFFFKNTTKQITKYQAG